MPTTTPPDLPAPSAALTHAREEMLAGFAVASDPECNPRLALVHLTRAWRWAFVAHERVADVDPLAMADWVRSQVQPQAGDGRARAAGVLLRSFAGGESNACIPAPPVPQLSRAATMAQLAALRTWIDAARSRERAGSSIPVRGLARAAIGIGISLLILVAGLRPWTPSPAPWRATYHSGDDRRGDPIVRRDFDLDFDWGRSAPMDAIPADHFSVEWDTCLELGESSSAIFQLIADEGATLFVDGRAVLDLDAHAGVPIAAGVDLTLDEGWHHLRVHYREVTGAAEVHLTATFDPEVPPAPIPAALLRYPAADVETGDPC